MQLRQLIFLALVLCNVGFAQQIPLSGSIGVPGSVAVLGGLTVTLTTDANYTLTPVQWANKTLIIASSVSLTATRTITLPLNKGQEYNVINQTTGGQSLTFQGSSGSAVTVASGATAVIFSDGANYYQVSGSGGGGGVASTLLYLWSNTATTTPVANTVAIIVKTITVAPVALPAASNWSSCATNTSNCPTYTIKDGTGGASGTTPIIVSAADGKLIDGLAAVVLQTSRASVTVMYDGTGWNIL